MGRLNVHLFPGTPQVQYGRAIKEVHPVSRAGDKRDATKAVHFLTASPPVYTLLIHTTYCTAQVSFMLQYYNRPWMIRPIVAALRSCEEVPTELVVNVDSKGDNQVWTGNVNLKLYLKRC